jgi:outer membrane receptor protein involved in Fe transport
MAKGSPPRRWTCPAARQSAPGAIRKAWIAVAISLFTIAARGQAVRRIEGEVQSSARVPIPGARVLLRSDGRSQSQTTDARGRFAFEAATTGSSLRVEAPGFVAAEIRIEPGNEDRRLDLVLEPAFSEEIAVTATRTPIRVSESAASVVVLSTEDLDSTAAPALDVALRAIPGFTLFRRSDSRTSNPTTQGASLRGVGGSGASRAAVLDDGVSLNDPFGGWVFWGRVPRSSVERLEVLRGGSSDLYGGAALAGTVNLIRRHPAGFSLDLETSYGSSRTPEASLFASGRAGSWLARVSAESFRTDGYVSVPPEESGAVDSAVASRHETLEVTVERGEEGGGRYFLRGNTFVESRENGTPLQTNDSRIGQVTAGADWSGDAGTFSLRGYALEERYHQTFSAIAADRASETLTRRQTVPSWAGGLAAQWSRGVGAHRLVAGLDAREVSGTSEETIFSRATTSIVDAGGKQETGAFFLEDVFSATPSLVLTAGLRADAWRNFDAFRRTGPDRSHLSTTPLADRSETAWSPRFSLLYRAGSALSLTASAYRSFRAPTLNELYRDFRVGDTLTLANDSLSAERLSGIEAGVLLSRGDLFARANLFWMEVEDPIANVTLSVTPSLITKQRQNLGRTRSRGVELDVQARISEALAVSAGYLYTDSTVRSFPGSPTLVGKRVAQVPRHQGTLEARWQLAARARLALRARFTGDQFEDDLGTLTLPGFATLDAVAAVTLARGLEVFAAGENLFNRRYTIGRTPVTTLGPPRSGRAGLRLRL